MDIAFHTIYVPGADALRDSIVEEQATLFDTCLHPDPDRNGCMWNWLRAIRCAAINDGDKDWVVMLSDDAKPLSGIEDHLVPALDNSPEDVLGLTHFGGYGGAALKKGAAYGTGRYLIWGGAIAIRASIVRELATFGHTYVAATGYEHDDGLIALFQAYRGQQTAMVGRALFGQPVKQSLLGHNTPIREPNTTIENSGGPPYARTSTAHVSRGSRLKFEERLRRVKQVIA